MDRRSFLGALGFTIIVPQFGPMFKQGQGSLVTPQVVTPSHKHMIVLASGANLDDAIAHLSRKMERFYHGMYGDSTMVVTANDLPTFKPGDRRGQYILTRTPKMPRNSIVVLPPWRD